MPLNYLEIQKQVQEFGDFVIEHQQETEDSLSHLRELLAQYADQNQFIRDRIEKARLKHSSLRCAFPGDEPLDQVYDAPEITIPDLYLLASDGSQIFPDSHGVLEYGVVNTGLLAMQYNVVEAPQVFTETKLYYPGISPFEKADLTEDAISFLRDVDERCLLSEKVIEIRRQHARENGGELLPMLALTDGPLDLFTKPGNDTDQTKIEFREYLDALLAISHADSLVAGYIERPRATMLVRTLELMEIPEDKLTRKGSLDRLYPGISDIHLFGELLKPGQRTGVFRLISKKDSNYSNHDPSLALHFFYINVGYPLRDGTSQDVFARVEIPKWIADDKGKVDLIHQVLIEQSKILGTSPYPYLLHRAHETAIVRFAEKEEIDRLIVSQLLAKGVKIDTRTQKSLNKRSSGS